MGETNSMVKVKRSCKNCGKELWTTKRLLKEGRGKYCSTKCRLACLNIKAVGWRAKGHRSLVVTRRTIAEKNQELENSFNYDE